MDELAEVLVVGFDIHVVHVEEVLYHCGRLGRVWAFGGAVESHAPVGVGAAGDEVVEEGDVAGCGDFVEMFQGVVVASPRSPAVVCAFCVCFVDVDAVVEEPVDVFARVCVVPR